MPELGNLEEEDWDKGLRSQTLNGVGASKARLWMVPSYNISQLHICVFSTLRIQSTLPDARPGNVDRPALSTIPQYRLRHHNSHP